MDAGPVEQGRRSTRLSISIPVVISGMDADGHSFRESVRTLIVNKHGGKIATAQHLTLNSEITVENLALSVVAKANVVWLSDKHHVADLHHVGLQLVEAQNVWGIAFPPDDWSFEAPDEKPAAAASAPAANLGGGSSDAQVSSLAGEELTIRLLQELQQSADDHTREFKARVKQLAQRVGLELEVDLREYAASIKAREVGALEGEIKTLREGLRSSRQEIEELHGRIQALKTELQSATERTPQAALKEARQQLSAMANSVVERMNTAAVEGLNEYRTLLQKENQESVARLRRAAAAPPATAKSRPREG